MSLRNNFFKFRLPILIVIILSLSVLTFSCKKKPSTQSDDKRLNITVTIFPIYDFTKHIGKDKINIKTLLPAGVEMHSFEPKPEDILKINKSDLFLYLDKNLEIWASNVIKGLDNKNVVIKEIGHGINFEKIGDGNGHSHDHHTSLDPHIWLDFERAKIMVDNIAMALMEIDKANAEFYKKNASEYKQRLENLDRKYFDSLKNCEIRHLVHIGHFAFGYLTRRYGITYITAYKGLSPNEEPTPKEIAGLLKEIKKLNISHLFYEDFISPRMAEIISKETNTKLLKLNGGHNVTKDAWDKGITYIDLMESNLSNIKEGLRCQ